MKITLAGFQDDNQHELIWNYDPSTYKAICNFQQNALEHATKNRLIETLRNKQWPGLVILDDELRIENLRSFIQSFNIEAWEVIGQEKIVLYIEEPLTNKEGDALKSGSFGNSNNRDRVRFISDKPHQAGTSFFSTSPPKPGSSLPRERIQGLSLEELIDRENQEERRDTFIHLDSNYEKLAKTEIDAINLFPLHTKNSFTKLVVCKTNLKLYPVKKEIMLHLNELFDSFINPAFSEISARYSPMKKRPAREALALFFNKTILLIIRAKPQYMESEKKWMTRVNKMMMARLQVLVDDKKKIDDLREDEKQLGDTLNNSLSILKLYFDENPKRKTLIINTLNEIHRLILKMGVLEYKNQRACNEGGTIDRMIDEKKNIYKCNSFVKIAQKALKSGKAEGPIDDISAKLTIKTRDSVKMLLFNLIQRLGEFGDLPGGGNSFIEEKKLLSNWSSRFQSFTNFYLLPNIVGNFLSILTKTVEHNPDLTTPELQEIFIQKATLLFTEQMNQYLVTMFANPLRESELARSSSPSMPASSSSLMTDDHGEDALAQDDAGPASSSGITPK